VNAIFIYLFFFCHYFKFHIFLCHFYILLKEKENKL
jgi:hypothetical protein